MNNTGVWSSVLMLQTAGLAFLQLQDKSVEFGEFLEDVIAGKEVDCQTMFPNCHIYYFQAYLKDVEYKVSLHL